MKNNIPDSVSFGRQERNNDALPNIAQQYSTGRITWGNLHMPETVASDVSRVIYRFIRALPEFVWNTAALEGNTYTLPEVCTLLDGVTVGGKRLEEAEQILAIRDAVQFVAELVRTGEFALTKEISNRVHAIVAKHEAIEAGIFRGEGGVSGGGHVRLSTGERVDGIATNQLQRDFINLQAALENIDNPLLRATVYFASATRSQFYFDGNKRTARLMMAGELLSNGLDAINVPYARKLEFNIALDVLFSMNDATLLLEFLFTCI